MIALYVGSNVGYSGKSLLILGLGLRLKQEGIKIGYIKPFGNIPVKEGRDVIDADAKFMKEALGIDDPATDMSPVVLTFDLHKRALKGEIKGTRGKVIKAFRSVKKGKDIVFVGGALNLYDGAFLGISGPSIINAFNARLIMVEPYRAESSIDSLLESKELLKDRLLGGVINKIPAAAVRSVKDEFIPFLKRKGIPVFGAIPKDSLLDAITVRQLNEVVSGRVLCSEEHMDEFIEGFLIGAMDVDSAIKYFRKVANKAVITGGHRADIQLAAMETSTRCLVLTGGMLPNDVIIGKARLMGIPIISVKEDTFSIVERIESVLGKIRIREEKKVKRAAELIEGFFDYRAFRKAIGI